MSCRLTYEQIDGMPAVTLENDLLKIGLLPGRGSDIYQFHYKPGEQDFLLSLKKGIRNPATHFTQIRDTKRQFEDYYYGGWQVCFPNSPAFNYRGAELGQHGEVSLIPWDFTVTKDTPGEIVITCNSNVLRLPLGMERIFSLKKDEASLTIKEKIVNTGGTALDVMWGQHIAFGLPFLKSGAKVECNAATLEAEPSIPGPVLLERGCSFDWPVARTVQGKEIRADNFPPEGEACYSELAYLENFPDSAEYRIMNNEIGFQLTWDGKLFKTLWMWQERNAIKDFPWWGDCFTLALEPWTSRWTGDPEKAIANGEWLNIDAGQEIESSFRAAVFETNVGNK